MSAWSLLVAGAVLAASAARPAGPSPETPRDGEPFLLTDVRVLSLSDGKASPPSSLFVRGGRVEWLGDARDAPPAADAVARIDGAGHFVMPGLVDAHVHIGERDELDLYLLNGVTTVLNLNGQPVHLEMRREVREGLRRGPRIYTAGRTIDGDPPRNPRFRPLGDAAEADALVAELDEAGYDFVKIYDLIERGPYDAVVAAARARGLPVVGHVPKPIGLEGVLGGHDLIAHAEEYYYTFFGSEPDRGRIAEAAALTAGAGVTVCPNIGFIRAIVEQASDIESVLAWPEFRYLPAATQIAWLPENNRYTRRSPEWLTGVERMYPFLVELTKGLHDAGVRLAVGSDANVQGAVPGFSLRKEIAELERAGLSRMDALRAATLHPASWIAEHLGDELPAGETAPGEIAPGARADFLVLTEDPREDLAALGAIRATVAAGRWHDRAELLAAVEARAEAYAAEVRPYHEFKRLIEAGEHEAAARAAGPTGGVLDEATVNRLGYHYLYDRAQAATAVAVFRFNAARYPESANVWDSLGEGLAATGETEAAIAAYERSLELDPANDNGREQLARLRAGR